MPYCHWFLYLFVFFPFSRYETISRILKCEKRPVSFTHSSNLYLKSQAQVILKFSCQELSSTGYPTKCLVCVHLKYMFTWSYLTVITWWEHSPPTNVVRVDAIWGLSLLLVLSLAPRGFSPGTLVFSSPQKRFPTIIQSGTHGHVSTSSSVLLSAS